MSNTKLFYTYRDSSDGKEKLLKALSAYSDSLIFDEDNRRIWHRGHQYGNSYWGSYHGETFNNFKSNTASGDYSHAEGSFATASGFCSHAEGESTIASAEAAHAEGLGTKANGEATHAEGNSTIASQDYSHAEGNETIANGLSSHAEGISTKANGLGSHAEGYETIAKGNYSHAEGSYTTANGNYSHTEGRYAYAGGIGANAGGMYTNAYGNYSRSEGYNTIANSEFSHAEGDTTVARAPRSHAEGWKNLCEGNSSHVEGTASIAHGAWSHAEGESTYTNGIGSHAEGLGTKGYGDYSHAEGEYTIANGNYSHAEGNDCTAGGNGSHAEGFGTLSQGDYSHTQGLKTLAFNAYEVAFGKYNEFITDNNTSYNTVFSIGDGTESKRHNIIDFRENGDMHKNGNSYFHDNIYGPVSNTYVKSLGESATLDIVLSSLLTQPEYTRPNITVKYSHSGNIEIGTYITPTITLEWPERTEHTNGTRAYTLENGPTMPNYLLGYSYGIKRIFLKYNNGINEDNTYSDIVNDFYDYEYNGEGLNAYGLGEPLPLNQSPVYILDENEYVLSNKIIITYLPSSYMYFQQLYDKNVYVYAYGLPPKEWTNGGTLTIGTDNIVYGKLKYYYGFSGDTIDLNGGNVPTVREIKNSTFGWLSKSSKKAKISITTPALNTNASKYCFWIAYPDTDDINDTITNKHYKLIANSDKFKIEVLMKDGMNFDLVSPDQPLKSTYIDLPIGNIKIPSITSPFPKDLTIRYKIAYIDFQKPIGNANNILKFSIATETDAGEAII